MPTITISRQFGSHGDTVAQLLCERLGYRYFDKNLMLGLADYAASAHHPAFNLLLRVNFEQGSEETSGFRFVGSTICYAHMQAVGMVNDHTVDCFRWQELDGTGQRHVRF